MNRAMRDEVPFGKARVGSEWPVYIVFEAGPTHDGLETALKLIDIAAEAGANAVKFQILNVEKLMPDPTVMFTYNVLLDKQTGEQETVTESLKAILERRSMPKDDWRTVIKHCASKGIEFFSTASTKQELDFLAEMGVGSVKIASGDITYHHFLREAAQYPWTVQIDTGNATIGEVEQAVDVLEGSGCENIIINHCPSGYPARLDGINLRVLTTLKQMFRYPVAFSDHSPGMVMDIAAVALGVAMVEKTITLDRTVRSPEHIMSLEPDEAKSFVQTIRDVEQALGNTRRVMATKERATSSVARRSIVTGRAIPSGKTLTQEDLDYARPGTGLAPHLDTLILGKQLRRDYGEGEQIRLSDIQG